MDATAKVLRLFDDLIDEGQAIKQSCKKLYFSGQKKDISPETFTAWKTSCLSLLKSTFGSSSPQFDSFTNAKFFDYYNATQVFLGILRGARQDVQKGYFFHKDLMLSVNIYDSLIARARKHLEEGRVDKARTILETVLHEVLGKICSNRRVPVPKVAGIEELAGILMRAEAIPESVKNELLELHGNLRSGECGHGDLDTTMEWILSFINEYLGGQILILN